MCPEVIIDGRGSGNVAGVNENNRLMVDASGTMNAVISGTIIIGSVTANVDSIYVQSGTMFISSGANVGVTQSTDPWIILGSARVVQDSTLRQISAGSININNFDDLGSSRVITAGSVNINNFNDLGSSRIITAGSFTLINVGSTVIKETTPIDTSKNNAEFKFEYIISGTAAGVTGSSVGSITQFIGAGSFVQVFTWSNDLVTNIGSWV